MGQINPPMYFGHNRHTDERHIIYISREIWIEHPSVGLASLAQLLLLVITSLLNMQYYQLFDGNSLLSPSTADL